MGGNAMNIPYQGQKRTNQFNQYKDDLIDGKGEKLNEGNSF